MNAPSPLPSPAGRGETGSFAAAQDDIEPFTLTLSRWERGCMAALAMAFSQGTGVTGSFAAAQDDIRSLSCAGGRDGCALSLISSSRGLTQIIQAAPEARGGAFADTPNLAFPLSGGRDFGRT
jgi:hypothetical protein